jgi:hypothetical protein
MRQKSSPNMTSLPVELPMEALLRIDEWADASGLTDAQFHGIALIMGARVMNASVGFADALTPGERDHMSEAVNTSVTSTTLLQVVFEGEVPADVAESEPVTGKFRIDIPSDMVDDINETADSIGMDRQKFYSLAFALGARVAAETLKESSVFPLDLIMQSLEGPVSPQNVIQTLMGRTKTPKPKKPPGKKKK